MVFALSNMVPIIGKFFNTRKSKSWGNLYLSVQHLVHKDTKPKPMKFNSYIIVNFKSTLS